MTTDVSGIISMLAKRDDVYESDVLIREVRVLLEIGAEHFHPKLRVKIYRSDAHPEYPFTFEASHHVKTPNEGMPYRTSDTMCRTEGEAIAKAIETTSRTLQMAIRSGHEPHSSWLVPDPDF